MSNKPQLIVIDDEPDSASVIADLAQLIGFEADVVDNAKEFLRGWNDQKYAVIVIDLCMPETDGIEVIQALARNQCTSAIIMISGFDRGMLDCAGDMAEALKLNLLGTFTKPFSLDDIEALLQEVLQKLG